MGPNFSAYVRSDPFMDYGDGEFQQTGPSPNAGSPNWPQQQRPQASPAQSQPAQPQAGVRGPSYPRGPPPVARASIPQSPSDAQLRDAFGRLTGPVTNPQPDPQIGPGPNGPGFRPAGPTGRDPVLGAVNDGIRGAAAGLRTGVNSTPMVRDMRANPNQVFGPVANQMRPSAQGVETTTSRPATPSTGVQPTGRRPSVNGPHAVATIPPATGLNTMPRQWDPNAVTPAANGVAPLSEELGFTPDNFGHMSRANEAANATDAQRLETEAPAPNQRRRSNIGAPSTRRPRRK